jgi:hypothetical protein
MAVGFGYIRDEQPAIVDWSAITREARATIKGIEADRQKKREGVDQAIRDQSEALLNRPKSQNTEYNAAMSTMTTQIEATMLQNYNDLRLGNIDLNQFNATKNTMMSETKGVLAIAKIYADQYDANVEGAQNGTLSGFSNWTNAMTQEMMDFQGVETFVGPNGKISFIKKKEDGTTETLDTSELFTLANMKQQKFDMEGAINTAKGDVEFQYIDELGETKKGYFVDPSTGEVNQSSISSAAASVVAQDSNAYGILYDYIGGYEFERLSDDFFTNNQTGEEQKAALEKLQGENDKVIYIDSNGLPMVSKKQRDVAQTYMEGRLRTQATTGYKQADYKAADNIDSVIRLRNAQAGKLTPEQEVATAFDVLVKQVETQFDFSEDSEKINQEIETGEYVYDINKLKQQLKFFNMEVNEDLMKSKDFLGLDKDENNNNKMIIVIDNPMSPGDDETAIKIDLNGIPAEQWQLLFRRKFTGIPGYTEYLATMAKGDISSAKFSGGQGGGQGQGGADQFNTGNN